MDHNLPGNHGWAWPVFQSFAIINNAVMNHLVYSCHVMCVQVFPQNKFPKGYRWVSENMHLKRRWLLLSFPPLCCTLPRHVPRAKQESIYFSYRLINRGWPLTTSEFCPFPKEKGHMAVVIMAIDLTTNELNFFSYV